MASLVAPGGSTQAERRLVIATAAATIALTAFACLAVVVRSA